VVKAGTMPIVVKILQNPEADERVQHQAVWCIGNIAADCLEYRRALADLGAIQALVTFLTRVHAFDRLAQDQLDKAKIRTGAWALYNLTRGCTEQDWPKVKPAIPVAAKLIFSNDQEVLVNGCWTIANLTDKNPAHVVAVIEELTLKRLVRLLTYRNPKVVIPVIKAVGYYVLVGEETTQRVIDAGALKKLRVLVNVKPEDRASDSGNSVVDPAMDTRKLALWLLAHIAASSAKHVEAMFEAEVISDVMALWKDDTLLDEDNPANVSLSFGFLTPTSQGW
jgi:importin subunit alpha-1